VIEYRIQRHSRSKHTGGWMYASIGLTWDLVQFNDEHSDFCRVYKIDNVIYKYRSKGLKLAVEKQMMWEKLTR